ncbi:MAG: hypothetical protein QOF61_2119 [Acidobacteriota bacterium]|jgi:hypothetical protein|nr:hypothetical protein [Acidobacteriota bacterium]
MRSTLLPSRLRFVYSLVTLALVSGAAFAQTPAPAKGQTTAPARAQTPAPSKVTPPKVTANVAGVEQPPWKLRVSKDSPKMVSLTAKNAPLSQISAELGKKLGVPVILSPLMQKQRVTLEVTNVPLEGVVRMLAPLPYVDYEVSGDGSTQPRLMGVFLYAFNEEPPSRTAVVKGSDEAILIEGNTEEGTEEYEKQREKEDSPLFVKFDRNQVSVRARKQPLSVVLFEIANKVDIPFEMKYESSDLVDVDFSNYTLEQAVHALSPNVHLYLRTNLSNYESIPLRLMLLPPSSSQQTIKM